MNEDRRRVLAMLAEGKITTDEAERLLAALERPPGPGTASAGSNGAPRYMRITVDADDRKEGPTKVNIRVPMQLLRHGVRLSSLIPLAARDKINAAMREKGVNFDIDQLRPENLNELLDQLSELTVDVDDDHAKVRVFCE
ncbi:MAG TPA: hypothetical protein VGS12_05705 [Caulobacteraceae bacterium]|nr:hypothetical protein [Caulobacteraceae bacterium]